MEIRLAKDTDGVRIARLAHADEADFDRVYPYWVIAEKGGNIVAAAQVSAGLPAGKVELLYAEEGSLRLILDFAKVYLEKLGSPQAEVYVPFKQKKMKKYLKSKYGAEVRDSGSVLTWRL